MILANLQLLYQETGGAQVVVTHDSRCAKAMADRVLWIKQGGIHKTGGPELCDEYFASLAHAPEEESDSLRQGDSLIGLAHAPKEESDSLHQGDSLISLTHAPEEEAR